MASQGGFKWSVNYELERPATTDGFVIQHVELDGDVGDVYPWSIGYRHWEAWKVDAGQTMCRPRDPVYGNDTYGWDADSLLESGTRTVTGVVKFYYLPSLPSDFQKGRGFCRSLPCTLEEPDFWSDSDGTAHSLEVTWDETTVSGYVQYGDVKEYYPSP